MRHTWLDARLLFRQINSRLKYDERRSKEKDESWKCKHLMFVLPQLWTHRKPKNHPFFLLYFSIYLLLSSPLSISPQYIFCSFLLYIRRFSIIAFQINGRPRQSINDYRLIAHLGYCNFLTTFSPNCLIQFIHLNIVLFLGNITK